MHVTFWSGRQAFQTCASDVSLESQRSYRDDLRRVASHPLLHFNSFLITYSFSFSSNSDSILTFLAQFQSCCRRGSHSKVSTQAPLWTQFRWSRGFSWCLPMAMTRSFKLSCWLQRCWGWRRRGGGHRFPIRFRRDLKHRHFTYEAGMRACLLRHWSRFRLYGRLGFWCILPFLAFFTTLSQPLPKFP